MKKKILLATTIAMMLGVPAWAYENPYAGISVKDGSPFLQGETKNVYFYTDFGTKDLKKIEKKNSLSCNFVAYYDADDVVELFGADKFKEVGNFSTQYFNEQFAELETLQKANLDLRTLNTPLLDIMKLYKKVTYTNEMLNKITEKSMQEMEKLTPTISLKKAKGRNMINIEYIYKQNKEIYNVKTSMFSVNDKLYLVGTVGVDIKTIAEEEAAKAKVEPKVEIQSPDITINNSKNKTTINSENLLLQLMEEQIKMEQLTPSNTTKALQGNITKINKKLLAGIKTFAPTTAERVVRLNDKIKDNSLLLPEDWYYAKLQLDMKKEGNGSIVLAGSVPAAERMVDKIFEGDAINIILQKAAKQKSTNAESKEVMKVTPEEKAKLEQLVKEKAAEALAELDKMAFIINFNIKNKDYQDMATAFFANKEEVSATIEQTLMMLKMRKINDFKLEDYNFNVDQVENMIKTNIFMRTLLFNKLRFDNIMRLGVSNNSGGAIFYTKQLEKNFPELPELEKQLNEWQF